MIRVEAFGPPEVSVDGEPPPRALLWKKNLALLLYLAMSPGRRRERDHLIGLFWGDKPESKARHSLNEALRAIRRAATDDAVRSVGGAVVLDESSVRLDVEDFEDALAHDDLDRGAGLIRGQFLEGFFVEASHGFEDWLHSERARLARTAVSGLIRLGEERLSRGNARAARHAGDRALAVDPLAEDAVRLALLARAVAGERSQAVALYEAYESRLASDLGMEPAADVAELMQRVRQEKAWRLPAGVPGEERSARRVPLVGRSEELGSALETLSGALERKRPEVLVVLGEPGVGKSRFVEELLARARLQGVRTAGARPIESDREIPGSAASEVIQQLTGSPADSTALRTAVAGGLQEAPLILWIDDADQADSDSLRALRRIMRDMGGVPLVTILTSSGVIAVPALDEIRAEFGRGLNGSVLTLTPFGPDEIEELAGSLMPRLSDEERNRLARRVLADSAGIPLLVLELLNAVRLGLELQRIDGAWPKPHHTLVATFPGDLPDSVVAALRVGFRRLSADAQTVLAAASVLGERTTEARLCEATGLDADRVQPALDELEWQRWLTADARGYSFVARVVQQVVRKDMLTPGQKRRILVAVGLLDE